MIVSVTSDVAVRYTNGMLYLITKLILIPFMSFVSFVLRNSAYFTLHGCLGWLLIDKPMVILYIYMNGF